MTDKLAIIDCGTNTFHLLIVSVENKTIITHVKDKIVVKIGEGGINNKRIIPEACERAIIALKAFKQKIDVYNISDIFAFATSAFRNATNGQQLKSEIWKETNINIEIISGKREAELIFYGVNAAIEITEPSLVMDIGGGSVEFIISKKDEVIWRGSFEIGAQRLLDLFHNSEPIDMNDLKSLFSYLNENLAELLIQLNEYQPRLLIGSSGTFDTLSDIYCEENGISRDLDGKEVPFDITVFKQIYHELITKTREERLKIPGMMSMRVDMIVVATAIIDFLLKKHNFNEMRVSTYSLKEGVLDRILHSQL